MKRVVTIEASLWVLPNPQIATLLAVAPRIAAAEDQFYPFLHDNAALVCKLEWWGYALLTCLQYLHDKKGIDLLQYMESELADAIRDKRRAVCAAVTFAEARKLKSALASVKLDETDMCRFFNDFSEETLRDSGKAMAAAFEATRRWLGEISDGHTGLMLID